MNGLQRLPEIRNTNWDSSRSLNSLTVLFLSFVLFLVCTPVTMSERKLLSLAQNNIPSEYLSAARSVISGSWANRGSRKIRVHLNYFQSRSQKNIHISNSYATDIIRVAKMYVNGSPHLPLRRGLKLLVRYVTFCIFLKSISSLSLHLYAASVAALWIYPPSLFLSRSD